MGKGQSKAPVRLATGLNLATFLLRPQNRGWVTTTAVVIASIIVFTIACSEGPISDLEGEDQRVAVKMLVLTAMLIIALCGLAIWAPFRELQDTVARGSTTTPSR